MITLLQKIFIKGDAYSPEKRGALGTLCSIVGILLNILLFAGKLTVGTLSGSVAITADAVNNLSDAGSSFITLAGFRIAGKKPDRDHPFGHGRAEYLAGMAVSVLIVIVGLSLARDSIEKIIHPEAVTLSAVTIAVLAVSVAVKVYMFAYNHIIGKRIDSAAMTATGSDSISDAISTSVVAVCTVIGAYTGIKLDGFCGLAVSAFILYTGIKSVRETVAPILGMPPDPELVSKIEELVMAHDRVHGIHDLVVHDYGPGALMISLHAEVNGNEDIYELHDEIDIIERELTNTLGCMAVIHMDPIAVDDGAVAVMRQRTAELLASLGQGVTIHDFRMVTGPTHTNIIFDAVIPYETGLSVSQAKEKIEALVSENFADTFAVVEIDRPYTK